MSEWKKEFQYLLNRKILSRDELAYLFGQLKSIIDSENEKLKAENEQLKKWQIKPTEAICLTDLACRYKKMFKND